MSTILIIVVIILLFGGGGGYYAHGRYGGAGTAGVFLGWLFSLSSCYGCLEAWAEFSFLRTFHGTLDI